MQRPHRGERGSHLHPPPQKEQHPLRDTGDPPPKITGTPLRRAGRPFLRATATRRAQGPLLHPRKVAVTPEGPPGVRRPPPQDAVTAQRTRPPSRGPQGPRDSLGLRRGGGGGSRPQTRAQPLPAKIRGERTTPPRSAVPHRPFRCRSRPTLRREPRVPQLLPLRRP